MPLVDDICAAARSVDTRTATVTGKATALANAQQEYADALTQLDSAQQKLDALLARYRREAPEESDWGTQQSSLIRTIVPGEAMAERVVTVGEAPARSIRMGATEEQPLRPFPDRT